MPRTTGSRNKGFANKKEALLLAMTDFAINGDLRRPSLREFAENAGVTEPTLKHYFGHRQAVVIAILNDIARRGEVIWQALASPSSSSHAALEEYFNVSALGLEHGGFVRSHAFGLVEGLADPEVGKVYVNRLLEPSLQIIIDKLKLSGAENQPPSVLHTMALGAFAPLLVHSLHQDLLGAETIDPIPSRYIISHLLALFEPFAAENS